jgi:dTDP-4-dehydrorhamnose reductase
MRIFITGGEGQLGRAIRRRIPGPNATAPAESALDITDATSVHAAIAAARPDIVIHGAALTDTMRCENEPKAAYAVNALGSGNVAAAAARAGARLVAISTNEVFAGDRNAPYLEGDSPHPLNEYGMSKLEGERRARSACRDAIIVRTAWLYGEGNNFIEKVLSAARRGGPTRFVTDEVSTPTSAEDLADAILALIEYRAPAATYHLTNSGQASRYEWAREIVRLGGLDPSVVQPVTTAEFRTRRYAGPRKPPYSVLANTRAAALGVTLRPWREAVAAYFERAQVAANG